MQSSALAANAAAQAALWRAGSPAPALQGMPPIQPLPPLQHDLSPRNPSGARPAPAALDPENLEAPSGRHAQASVHAPQHASGRTPAASNSTGRFGQLPSARCAASGLFPWWRPGP